MSSYYANRKRRKILADLSEKVFGTRSKYQYFVQKRGYTIEAIESQMKLLETEIERVKNEQNGTEGQNRNIGKKTVRLNRTTRRKILRARAKRQRKSV